MSARKNDKGAWGASERFPRIVLIWLLVLMLSFAGCGGGGGDTGSENSNIGSSGDDSSSQSGSAPEAAFTVSTDIGSGPLEVVFDALGSSDADGGTLRYDWEFGDGNAGEGVNPTHTYKDVGAYTARLTVTDESDLTGTATRVIDVTPLYTVSGVMTPAGYLVSDSDVNDPNKRFDAGEDSNDDFASAQEVCDSCTVSGYVNKVGTGADGRSVDDGDPYDVYKATLAGGTHITLYMAEDPAAADLNLNLYDAGENLVDASVSGISSNESLTAPEDGVYYVEVSAETAASAYILAIGSSGAAAASSPLRLSDNFVPGEILVRFETDSGEAVSDLAGTPGHVSPMGFSTRSHDRGRDRLLRRSETVERSRFFNRLGVQSSLDRSLARGHADAETRAKMETLWMVRAMEAQPGVVCAQPNYILKAFATQPDDPLYSQQWHYPLINLPAAWDITTGSSDVTVAVIDSGVLPGHPDLDGQLVDGYDFVDKDADPTDENTECHGTHVAGTVAAASDNDLGVAGIAWSSKIMPLRVLDATGSGTTADILEAVKYAAGLDVDGPEPLDEPVDVINLSLGRNGSAPVEQWVYREARDQGVIIIAAAGNEVSSSPSYPAAYDGVVSVSAVAMDESRASYSNWGNTIDVAAPGGDGSNPSEMVLSTCGEESGGTVDYTYAYMQGTSMASPHVAGVVALMKSLYPGMTPDEFDYLLQGGYLTRDIGDTGRDDFFGWGLIDAYKAVSVVQDGNIDEARPATLTVSPTVMHFGAALSNIEVAATNSGSGALALADGSPTWSASWLSVTATGDVGADGLGTYVVAVDPEGLSEGKYYDTIFFTASGGAERDVSVIMRVASEEESPDTGYYYILLIDADTHETVGQVETGGAEGVYGYSFGGLSYGDSYIILAGTDPDNDYHICNSGEACGTYMSLGSPVKLTVTSDLSGIDFTTDAIPDLSSATVLQNMEVSFPLEREALKQDEE